MSGTHPNARPRARLDAAEAGARRTRRRAAIGVLLLAAATVGCAPARRPARPAADARPAPVPALYDTQRRIADYIDSGRYDAEVARVVAQAAAWLDRRAPEVRKPAIVLDIDETALSNWRAYRVNGWARITNGPCDVERGPCGIHAWQAMAGGVAIAPTLRLVERARVLGVAVFFLTGRPTEVREVTERNLREQGFDWDRVIMLPSDRRFRSGVDFKAPERKRLVDAGYTIVLSLGDQQSDLDGGHAERTFKLPNPVYYLP
ncbi:MAG: acid phosphatase [Deltaproteobacteria bacterium]|nr:acid phosphatase [Deltaproteobacteria bacterium]